jgi:asparagine synthase (glutamine-hydrolysing)
MSGIVGVWHLDGRPFDERTAESMTSALAHRGADGEAVRHVGSVWFSHQHFWITPEEIGEAQPLLGGSGAMLSMDGRLDNRDELVSTLRLPATTSDAACALAAYERWPEDFAARLAGDFALAIFDDRRQKLLLARDAIGMRPLYYYRSDRLFAFSSEIKALLAHPDVPARPDDDGVADFMLIASRPIDQQELTCFAGVSAVVPAHVVITSRERTVARRYWDFDVERRVRLGSIGEYAEAFRACFEQAVRRRTRSAYPVALSLSGGLDSSSIFCVSRALGSARTPGIVAVSYTGQAGTDADEGRFLIDLEREQEAVIDRFPMEPLLGLVGGADEQIAGVEAPFIDHVWGVTTELHRRATAAGARVLLSGTWGDQVLFSSAYLVDLFSRPAWRQMGRHLREYERWLGREEAVALRRRFYVDAGRRLMPRRLLGPLKKVRRRFTPPARAIGWFSDAFLRRALRFADQPVLADGAFHSAQARAIYLQARSKYHVHCMEWNNKIGAMHGLDAALPFLDRDLIAFLMAVPGDAQNADGVPRGLLREAMRGVLPESIRTRSWKANFSGAVNRGLARDIASVTRALTLDALVVRFGYVDPSRLGREIDRRVDGLSRPDCVDSWSLADLFGLEVWLQVFFGRQSPAARARHVPLKERVG